MSKDIPIIFSGPMVRALLDGRKTMTRRLVSLQNCEFGSISVGKMSKLFWGHAAWSAAWPDRGFPDADGVYRNGYLHVPCHDDDVEANYCGLCSERGWSTTSHRLRPKFQPGDRLWVRENFAHVGTCDPGFLTYQATYPDDLKQFGCENVPATLKEAGYKWTPCIHMPRTLSRLTLIVTAVKVEPLLAISASDLLAEGVCPFMSGPTPMFGIKVDGGYEHAGLSARETFMNLWCSLHGPSAWNDNPWVVARTFRVIKANIDAPEAGLSA